MNSDKSEKRAPYHVAIIMDGNGRWAKKHLVPRKVGHSQGSKTVEKICEAAFDRGVKYLTVYAFSTENWSRSDDEIAALMDLLRTYMKECLKKSKKNNMRVRVIGDVSRLDEDLQRSIRELEEASKGYTGLNFQVALNYGGRDDIVRAVRDIAKECRDGKVNPGDIDEEYISSHLDTSDIPDPDLLIRTSGEQRISNFLLWQLAYSEMYFSDALWPDFSERDLEMAIDYYNRRERRYGGRTGE